METPSENPNVTVAAYRTQVQREREANAAWTKARDEARRAGASRDDSRIAGIRAAREIVPGWDQRQREHRQMRDRWERCRQRWQGRIPTV